MDLPFALSAGIITFVLGVIWGGPFVEVLRRLKIGKSIRVELGDIHTKKIGTPTLGGIMIVVPVLVISLILNIASVIRTGSGASIFLPLFVLMGFALLGLIDDWEGILNSRARAEGKAPEKVGLGLSPRVKFAGQVLLAGVASGFISLYQGGFSFANEIILPLIPISIPLPPLLFIPLSMFIIVGMSNAVNFTDGLDGLAGIISASAFAAYGVIAFLQGQIFLTQLCFIIVGACFAFLWFNAHPAQLFMGDVGSMALGSALGTIAVMTGQWLLLPIIALVPVIETLSVILQVWYYKATKGPDGIGQRLFRRAPIHHHFELSGWSETQVVQRFWLVGLLSAMIGVALALL
ncbi:MAG: phospho-N-acetylmuramoyl-pentapeptide-transferase [Chloroflexi bacterium]|nr:phospho-N-acetylmuramoyl-pentapeptide-transferase [Chloroflexota bacterium]